MSHCYTGTCSLQYFYVSVIFCHDINSCRSCVVLFYQLDSLYRSCSEVFLTQRKSGARCGLRKTWGARPEICPESLRCYLSATPNISWLLQGSWCKFSSSLNSLSLAVATLVR